VEYNVEFVKRLLSVILSMPIIVFGLAYVFLWVIPLDLIKQRNNRKKPFNTHPLPMQNLIDKVKEENTLKSNDWGGA
jgi:hypothetical protein